MNLLTACTYVPTMFSLQVYVVFIFGGCWKDVYEILFRQWLNGLNFKLKCVLFFDNAFYHGTQYFFIFQMSMSTSFSIDCYPGKNKTLSAL